MMKKKSVMKVHMDCEKCRKKALQIAAGTDGVHSVTNEGKDMELITVVGVSVDTVCLVTKLRKKIGYTKLVSVTDVKEDDKKDKYKINVPWPDYYRPAYYSCPPPVAYGTVYDTSPSICSIM